MAEAARLEKAEKVPPLRRLRPRPRLLCSFPAGRKVAARGWPRAGSSRTIPGVAGSAGRAPPAPGAQDRPRGAQPVLTTPRSGSPGGGRGGRCGWSRSRVSAGRGSRRRENGGGGGGGEEGQRRLEAAAPAHAAQPQQPGSPTAQAGRPWRQGLYRGQRGPRPFLPPPPPARPAPPSRRLLCVPAGRRVPVPALRGAPAPATAQPRPPPTGSRRWTEPRKRRETRRPRGAAPARAELHVGRRVPGVCVWEGEGPKGLRRVPGTQGE